MDSNTFSQFHHIGAVVKDIQKSMDYLSSLGIGPWGPMPGKPFMGNKKLRGKPADYKLMARFAPLGPIQLELVQPLGGECVQQEFLEKRGEGVNHLGFLVKDIDKTVAELAKQGVNVIQSGPGTTKGGFAYLDTEAACGLTLELVEWDED
jgi:methylmalonyl-CoA/ethylmalonyl-CoA epimerase